MADSRLMKTRDGHPGKHGTSKGALALSTPRFTLLPDTIFVHVAATSPWLGTALIQKRCSRHVRDYHGMFVTMFATIANRAPLVRRGDARRVGVGPRPVCHPLTPRLPCVRRLNTELFIEAHGVCF